MGDGSSTTMQSGPSRVRPRRASARSARTLPSLMTTAVERNPSALAVICGGAHLQYRELDERSSRLARVLIALGAGPETRVAIALERSIDSVVSVWAVAKTGAAFVPINPDYPQDRIDYQLADSGALLGITHSNRLSSLSDAVDWLALDTPECAAAISAAPAEPISYADRLGTIRLENTAYVIYTSGSTGRPKGVSVTHTGLAGFCDEQRERYRIESTSRTLHFASPAFDAAVLELLLAVGAGATMVIAPQDVLGGDDLATLLRREAVTHAFVTPAALATVDPAGLDALGVVIVGGEACPTALVDRWAHPVGGGAHRRFFNGYGPTETTIMSAISSPLATGEPVTIGGPIRATSCFVLDARLNTVPDGVAGELYIAGPGLARGYHERPALSAERFVPNQFGEPGDRLYRTGDIVRWSTAQPGSLEYIGRNDLQVKIRGFRIELGEIDAALMTHDGVSFAITVDRVTPAGETVLVSYVLPDDGLSLVLSELISTAERKLPRHMVPGVVMVIDRIPLTPVGKLDRHALPAPAFAGPAFRAPSGPLEELVAAVFSDLLRVDTVGADDDFFWLGGNSLVAIQLAARLGAALEARIAPRSVFEHPTVSGLATAIAAQRGEGARPALVAGPRPDRIPLSYAQQRYWFLNQFNTSSAVDNIPFALRLSGPLDVDALHRAVADLVGRHESLRTIYPTDDDGPYQVVLPPGRAVPDLSPVEIAEADIHAEVLAVALRGFDVSVEAPLHARLFTVGADHVLAVVVHHIAADGFSMLPFGRDLLVAYSARTTGAEPQWRQLRAHYADYALWQRELLGSEDDPESLINTQIDYWTERLAGLPDQLDLPSDRPRPPTQSFVGSTVRVDLDAALHRDLLELGRTNGATLFMVMRSALAVLLARLSGTDDIAVGAPTAGRGEADLDDLIGMFVNTLVFRTHVDGNESFDRLLTRVREDDLQAFAHSDVPFERLVQALNPERSTARNPLFQVGLSFQNLSRDIVELDGLTATAIEFDAGLAKTDLQIGIVDTRGDHGEPAEIALEFGYATDLFDESTVAGFAARFERILRAVVADASAPVGDIVVLDDAEVTALTEWSHGDTVAVSTETLPDLFGLQADATPDAIALATVDGRSFTYREFDEHTNKLARWLISTGVGPETPVALVLRRSHDLVAAMYAVAKAGGSYVPIDPDQPADRNAYILDVAAPTVVLDADTLTSVDLGDHSGAPITDSDRSAPLRGANTAYVLFTSGSTGRPKGVAVTHAAITNQLVWKQDVYPMGPGDVVPLQIAATFDVSMWEFWSPLVAGATLVVSEPGAERDPARMRAILDEFEVTNLHIVPSMLSGLLVENPALPPTVRRVLAIGEALPHALAQDFLANNIADLINLYGPTEAAVSITATAVTDPAHITIGTPAFNSAVHILDTRLQPVPVGVAGELYLAGEQLARGYLHRPDLTADRFVANPFGAAGDRLYRTGDLVARTDDGDITYLGRTDFQIKVRGFRIELGDIETALTGHESVAQSAVIAHKHPVIGTQLVAYVTGEPGCVVDTDTLQTHLSTQLPSYMLPSMLIALDAFPTTAHGKLDRKSLPAPKFATAQYRAPGTDAETVVAEVFADLLGVEQVGLDDDFFVLGGNSLVAMRVVARIGAALECSVPVRELFEAPTVAALAARVEQHRGAGGRLPLLAGPRPALIPLSPAQRRMWFLNQFGESPAAYNVGAAVRLTGELDVAALTQAVTDVVERHETLRTTYPETPQGPVQVVLPSADLALTPVVTSEDELYGHLVEVASTAFDVTAEVPLRVRLFAVGDDHVLAVVVHHIAADGSSVAPLTRDLMIAYASRTAGAAPAWQPLPVQYADFSLWQGKTLGVETDPDSIVAQQLSYWRSELAELPELLELPTDRPRPPVQSFAGDKVNFHLDGDLHAQLTELAQANGATLFMVVHTALAVLLARLSGGSDIAIGTPVAGRGEAELDDMVGMFVNTLVFRTRVDVATDFASLLGSTREADLGAFANADVPFETIVEALNPARSTAHHPIFQVGLAFQNMAQTTIELPGLTLSTIDADAGISKYDLEVTIVDGNADGLGVQFGYATDLFDKSTVAGFAARFERILRSVVADASIPVGDIAVVDDAEATQLTAWSRGTDVDCPASTLTDLFDAQVQATPGAVAVKTVDGESLTYGEFDARANRLARWLIAEGVAPEAPVALSMRRSLDLVTAMYAVAKAGGSYVPIDPDQPTDRIDYILSIAAPTLVLDSATLDGLDLSVFDDAPVVDSDRITPLRVDNTAYVLFTSGSTGRPKGVAVTHAAINNQLQWMRDTYPMGPGDVVALKIAATFDVSMWEFWSPLVAGATLVITEPGIERDPARMRTVLAEHRVTNLHIVPSILSGLLVDNPALPDSVVRVLAIGEALPEALARDFTTHNANADLVNLYGPTEAAVSITATTVTDPAHITIGNPAWNSQVHVLDTRLRPVPAGVPGELYLAGVQLARGYLGRPDLTADRFVADPHGAPGDRLYRTGDLVKRTASGDLEYIGRTDFQVKVRGFRIELGDIETALNAHHSVAKCAVLAYEDAHTGTQLVAYLQPIAGTDLDTAAVRTFLTTQLPAYMVPGTYIALDTFPTTSHGKLDRKALPQPSLQSSAVYEAPRSPLEMQVADVFATVLGVDRVGIDDDFFALGGNSLLVFTLRAELQTRAAFEVTTQAVFRTPTVRGLIDGCAATETPVDAAAELAADARLDPAITLAGLESAHTGTPRHVLLTGATGFVGAQLLRELLEGSDTRVWCLVRAENAQAATERIHSAMRHWSVWDDAFATRIIAVPGDLASPQFGLRDAGFDLLAEQIDVIYHNGARVNHLEPYEMMRSANVLGTHEVLRLATTTRMKPVHYVSTYTTVVGSSTPATAVVREDTRITAAEVLGGGGYGASKWAAEQLVLQAADRGLPVSIFRPGLISGDVVVGAMSTDDAFWNMIRAAAILGQAPDLGDAGMPLVPVTYVAKAIVAIGQQVTDGAIPSGHGYHLANQDHTPIAEIFDSLRRHGLPVETASLEEVGTRLVEEAAARNAAGDDSLVRAALVSDNYRNSGGFTITLDETNTRAALAGTSIECPLVHGDVVDAYVRFFIEAGFFPRPTTD